MGVGNRDDFRAALEAVLIERHEHKVLFDQAFDLFWRNPKLLERMMALLLPKVRGRVPADQAQAPLPARLAEAMAPPRQELEVEGEGEEIDLDAAFTFSPREVLQTRDFESMTAAELPRGQGDDCAPAPAAARDTGAAHDGRAAGACGRPARDAARDDLGARRDRAAGVAPTTPPPSAAGRPVRYFGIDGPLLAHAAVLPARDHQ